jgi:hypothetical protein
VSCVVIQERVNVARLFDRRDLFPDVILQYQGQDIYAHRAILALGSPKLQNMFDDHSTQPPMMQENKPVYLLDDDIKGLQLTDVSRIIKVPMQPNPPLFYYLSHISSVRVVSCVCCVCACACVCACVRRDSSATRAVLMPTCPWPGLFK